MKFSVVIPTYNDWQRLVNCLDALEQQAIEDENFEVIVVNNSENKEVPKNLDLPRQVNVVHEPTPGSYAARNKGAEVAAGEILAFTDSDCIPDPGWLLNAREGYQNSETDLIGGEVQIFRPGDGSEYAYIYDRHTAFPQYQNVPQGKSVTANLFVKKSVFEKVGGFDATMKSGGDWDFTLRCTDMGYKMIYGEDILVLHPSRKDVLSIMRKQYRLTCWGSINVREKFGHSQLRILISHLLNGLKGIRKHQSNDLDQRERAIIFVMDILLYLYRTVIHGGILLGILNPNKVRE